MKLTKRQSEVITLVQRGLSNKQIAKSLNIVESTVKLHVTALLKIYAARNRNQLAIFSSNNVKVQLPNNLEELPFAWVKRHGNIVIGIVFKSECPIHGWEPLYLKKS
jgi:DNA-binding CsgD family transcriptional regulator